MVNPWLILLTQNYAISLSTYHTVVWKLDYITVDS